jgi:ATP-dependent DNA ligase
VEALASFKGDFDLDGELVVLDLEGRPSFQLLQCATSGSLPTYSYAFDVLSNKGELLVDGPLSERRAVLESLLAGAPQALRISSLLQAPAGQILQAVRQLGLEGIVGKRIDSVYEPGERSGAWIKLRANLEQEFVIGGYIPGARGFDALLVGIYEKKELVFVAKVKNGFVPRIRDDLFAALKALQTAQCKLLQVTQPPA